MIPVASAAPAAAPPDGAPGVSRLRLVVFQLEQTSLALLVDEACAAQWTQPLWYEQLRSLLLPELQPLAAALLDAHGRMGAVEDPHRFIYFNRSNLKSSIKPTKYGLSGRLGLHAEPRALLNRMHADLTDGGEGVREVALQTPGSHGWLRADQRHAHARLLPRRRRPRLHVERGEPRGPGALRGTL